MSGSSTLPLPLKFKICDIRGLEVEHLMTKENMRYVLEGNIADRFPVSLNKKMILLLEVSDQTLLKCTTVY